MHREYIYIISNQKTPRKKPNEQLPMFHPGVRVHFPPGRDLVVTGQPHAGRSCWWGISPLGHTDFLHPHPPPPLPPSSFTPRVFLGALGSADHGLRLYSKMFWDGIVILDQFLHIDLPHLRFHRRFVSTKIKTWTMMIITTVNFTLTKWNVPILNEPMSSVSLNNILKVINI